MRSARHKTKWFDPPLLRQKGPKVDDKIEGSRRFLPSAPMRSN